MAAPAPDFLSKAGIFFLQAAPVILLYPMPWRRSEGAEGDLLYCPIDPIP